MTTRGQVNSNFYQIVDIDSNGNPTQVKSQYINVTNVANSNHANVADVANSVAVANVVGLGNIATINLDGSSSHVLYGNGVWAPQTGGGGNGTPGGSNTQVQFNDNGNFAGSSNLTFNKTTNTLSATNISGTIITGSQPDITSLGTLTGLTISGAVTGELVPSSNITYSLGNTTSRWKDLYLSGNSIYLGAATITSNGTTVQLPGANISGDIVTSSNANIGQNLNVTGDTFITGNITVSGNTNYTNVNNLYVTDPLIELGGGPNGAPLTNNDGLDRGEILHYYTTQPVDAFIGWVNGSSQFAMASNVTNNNNVVTINTLGNLRIDTLLGNISGSNVVGAVSSASHATVADSANSVAGANVTGYVANASHATVADSANSVAVANVVGIGNIATVNLNGNASQVLSGAGTWVTAGAGGTPGGANTQIQFNDSGSFGGSANLTFDKTTNTLAVTSITGNLSTSGQLTSTVATGTAPFVVTSTTTVANLSVANATFATSAGTATTAGTVTTNAQPNITSLGTLTSLSTSGQLTSSVATGTAPFVVTSTTTVANLSVANATFATTAGTATSATTAATVTAASQPNITSVGSTLTVSTSVKTSNLVAQTGGLTTIQLRYLNDGDIGVTGNIVAGVSGTGNVTATTFIGNGSFTTASVTGTANVGNLVTTKYNETVVAGGSTGAATITPNVASGTIFNYTLTGNITINSLANAVAGSGATLILTQDATGGRTLTSTMKFLGGSKTLSTAANAIDIMSVFFDGTTYYASLGKGFA